MTTNPPAPRPILLPAPIRQLYFQEFLAASRSTVLLEGLLATVATVSPLDLANELATFAPIAGRRHLQSIGLRDEQVFAVPAVLRARPSLLGYYRLLAGLSQKQFYGRASGLSVFQAMELSNTVPAKVAHRLHELCLALNESMGEFLDGVPGGVSKDDIVQLPLLSLGAQVDGSWRTQIGQLATKQVYAAIRDVVKSTGTPFQEVDETSLTLTNASSRQITAALAADPDVVIREEIGSTSHLKVAIEIKGGLDKSNVHNRAGEAEKSHQKARAAGAADYWTVISLARTDEAVLRSESPTTRQWFDVTDVVNRRGDAWQRFDEAVRVAMGI